MEDGIRDFKSPLPEPDSDENVSHAVVVRAPFVIPCPVALRSDFMAGSASVVFGETANTCFPIVQYGHSGYPTRRIICDIDHLATNTAEWPG